MHSTMQLHVTYPCALFFQLYKIILDRKQSITIVALLINATACILHTTMYLLCGHSITNQDKTSMTANNQLVTAIIQARMQSTRLPQKSLLPLAGKPLLAHVIERAKAISTVNTVVLAIPDDSENDSLVTIAQQSHVAVFRGSMHNVLERFYMAYRRCGGSYIVRITADNPFTDAAYASIVIDTAIKLNADLCAAKNLPLGTGVEVIKAQALERAYTQSTQPHHFEHVTPYIKENPDTFAIHYFDVPLYNPFSKLRLTVDTQDDYTLAKHLYDALYTGTVFSLEDVIKYLEKNPALVSINATVQQKSMTSHE